jgi:hypothetical protein
LKDEQLGHDQLVEVLGPRPFENDAYQNFIKNTREFAAKYGEESVKDKTVRDNVQPDFYPEEPNKEDEKSGEKKL